MMLTLEAPEKEIQIPFILKIDERFPLEDCQGTVAIDVETDEKDNFVGAAVCYNSHVVFYYTNLSYLKEVMPFLHAIGHNLKGDIHWLRRWGVGVDADTIIYDTMLASYVQNPVRASHGLKPLAKELLQLEWPSYRDMVGKGKAKVTLDKQPTEHVARYCAMDAYATYNLWGYFERCLTPNQKRTMERLELPLTRALFDMEERGIKIDVALLAKLSAFYDKRIERQLKLIKDITGLPDFNPNSYKQKKEVLKRYGYKGETTDKKELVKHKREIPLISHLLLLSAMRKLQTSFINPFKEMQSLPFIFPTFNQVSESRIDEDEAHSITTGRLSCSSPNLQQIPARSRRGRFIRQLFIPSTEERHLIVADYSQIELRLAAHFSNDPILVNAFKNGEDIHDATGKALGVDRFYGKTANFLLAFGGSEHRLASALNIDVEKALEFKTKYWRAFSVFKAWKETAIRQARREGGVQTLFGRWVPIEGLLEASSFKRGHAERVAISCIIQGSAADIMKLAIIKFREMGELPNLTIHDELVFDCHSLDCMPKVKETLENIVTLKIPLEVTIGHGPNWSKAKA